MFSFEVESLATAPTGRQKTLRYRALLGGGVISYGDTINLWRSNKAFRTCFISQLADAPFDCYRWETPCLSIESLGRPFEFVLIDSPGLTVAVDRFAFRDYFAPKNENAGVVSFKNLGGDAVLVCPSPLSSSDAFSHLARFTRTASETQNQALWQTVGHVMAACVKERPVWLNTAGDGVSWLHIRLDSRPKYYHHAPYREESFND